MWQMDFTQAQMRAEKLREQLSYHSRLYYIEDNPEISDYEYDLLSRELRALEKQGKDSRSLQMKYKTLPIRVRFPLRIFPN